MAVPRKVSLKITYDGTTKSYKLNKDPVKVKVKKTYTVKKGDTLWGIAKKQLGSGSKSNEIYKANSKDIEKAAKAKGKTSSQNGKYIYAGTVLTIPGKYKTVTKHNVITQEKKGKSRPELAKKIQEQATAFSYTDIASGQSDSMSITMCDIDKKWMTSRFPRKGADMKVVLNMENWEKEKEQTVKTKFTCGTFILDDISFSGRPLNCVINGLSLPANSNFRLLPRSKTYKNVTIKQIAKKIIKRTPGIKLSYSGKTINIDEIEQNKETDCAFLSSLCQKYDLAMKMYNRKIVIFDIASYEKKKAVKTIKETDMISWSYNSTIDGTYTGATFSYSNPDSKETINVTVGKKTRLYSMNAQASSKKDAELQAMAKVNSENRKIETLSVTIMAKSNLVASHCVKIKGLGKIDGKYYIDQIKHSIGSSGYTMQLSLHRVQKLLTATKKNTKEEVVKNESGGLGSQYTVVSGDTLWAIAKKFLGAGNRYGEIYNANSSVIEEAAKSHGKTSSSNGHWIYPGTVLNIPG